MGSLKYQFQTAIEKSFYPGTSKHNYKDDNRIIFSYSEKICLTRTACNLVNTLEKLNPDIKMIRDIKPEHIKQYLEQKKAIWSDATIKSQFSLLGKIEVLAQQTYKKSGINFMEGVKRPMKPIGEAGNIYRTLTMERKDFDAIMGVSNTGNKKGIETPSTAAIKITGALGLRVSELSNLRVKNIDIDNNTIKIIGKGGKERALKDITPGRMAVVKEIYAMHGKGKRPNDYLFNSTKGGRMDQNSINKQLGRLANGVIDSEGKNLKAKYSVEGRTSIHAIRKMYATERYNEYRGQGLSIKESGGRVMDELGHGRQRTELCRIYIANYGE